MSTAWPGGAELPTEPVGSLPRPSVLQRAVLDAEIGQISAVELERAQDAAVRDTLDRFAETGSPLVSDGEQRRQSFSSYPLGTSPHDGGVEVGPVFAVFADGHHRVIPSLASGPFRFRGWAARPAETRVDRRVRRTTPADAHPRLAGIRPCRR